MIEPRVWRRFRRDRAALAGSLLLLLGCDSEPEPPIGRVREVVPQRGGILRSAFYTDVRSLDPAVAFDTGSSAIEDLLFDSLVSYDDSGRITPQLAETVDVSPDGKRYVFSLRRGVLFHDGTELKAADVKRSLERTLHADTPCPVPSFFERVAGYRAFHEGKASELSGVTIAGEYSVELALSEPDATLLHVLALPISAPVCRSAGKIYSPNFSTLACGTGPFKLVYFENGQEIRLSRHAGYWKRGEPYLDEVRWYLNMPKFSQRVKFERGDLDYMREFSEDDSLLYRRSPAWKGLGGWEAPLATHGLFMNTEVAPFDNRHVRRAVTFALDHSAVALLEPGHIQEHRRVVPGAILRDWPGMKVQAPNLERALEEMRLSGLAYDPVSGKGGYPKEIPYVVPVESLGERAAQIFQQQLASIGLRIRLQIVGWPAFLATVGRRKTASIGYVAWKADFPDASNFFEPTLSTAAIQDEDSQNWAFFSDSELDQVLAAARRSTDPAERERLYRRAEEIVAAEAPWAVGSDYRYFELWHAYVHGYRPNPVLVQRVRGMWFDREQKPSEVSLEPRQRLLPGLARGFKGRQRSTLALVGADRR